MKNKEHGFLKGATKFVGNNAKGQISKRVFQENKARHVRTCAYQRVRG